MTLTNTTTEARAEPPVASEANTETCNHALVLHKAMVNWLMHDVIGKHPVASSGSGLLFVLVALLAHGKRRPR